MSQEERVEAATPSASRRVALTWLVGLAATAGLAACGKKGEPNAPEGTTQPYPRRYPQ